jgi:DNA-binding MarR family transcriptional regulator
MKTAQQRGEALGHVLDLASLVKEDLNSTLARDGLTEARARVLWVLHERGPSSQRALADALSVSARNVTGLVDALAETGFVARQPHPSDRRVTVVAFTPRGGRCAKAMAKAYDTMADLLFGALTDRQFDGFATGLAAVLKRLRGAVAP